MADDEFKSVVLVSRAITYVVIIPEDCFTALGNCRQARAAETIFLVFERMVRILPASKFFVGKISQWEDSAT